jgi:transmembrane sensor
MTGDEKFTALLKAYLDKNASDAESTDLMGMIKSGGYDHLLKQYIDNVMYDNRTAKNFDDSRAGEILQSILNAEKQTDNLIPLRRTPLKPARWFAAAAAVLILGVCIWMLIPDKKNNPEAIAKNETKHALPGLGKQDKKYLHLEDGSTVLLNEGSHIDYPAEFSGATREITLTGEAYFDIHHDSERPFIVHTGQVSTTVLGTAFNIRAYPGQQSVTVTVTRGKVKVSEFNKMIGIITPNESISVDMQRNTFRQETVNAEQVMEWKKKYLVLDDISFEDAAVLIESKYHVKISFVKEALKQCHISATFMNNESLEQVLTVLTGVINATYKLQPNDQVIIGGEGCK